jgi:hypothetical protein
MEQERLAFGSLNLWKLYKARRDHEMDLIIFLT